MAFPGVCKWLAAAALLAAACGQANAAGEPRERIPIDGGWSFHPGDPEGAKLDYDTLKPWILPAASAFIADPARRHARPAGDPPVVRADFDAASWRTVNLPHDWAIAGPFITDGPEGGMGRLKSWGAAWYRRNLDIPARDKGRSIFLDVDGAMSYGTAWLNGRLIGGWPYGYASWRVDLTPFVVPGGANELAIRLDNPPQSSRWYPGAGLYRNVWLTKTNPVHVAQWGTFVKTPQVSRNAATVTLDVTIDNDGAVAQSVDASTEIYAIDGEGRRVGRVVARISRASTNVAGRSSARVSGSATVANPQLWGPLPTQRPNRYVAVTTLAHAGRVIDRYETRFGIRSIRFDPNSGIYVNDERIPLNGVNGHHDLGALGAAFNERAAERQIQMLQEMGANALRTAHNPPAPELLELTDRMGMLVLDEIFDVWELKKTPRDFHLIFPEWHEADLRAFLRRDRNNPSVFLWSVGNEVGEQQTGEAGAKVGKRLVAIVREEDATRPTMTAMNWSKPDQPLPAAFDVISLNYQGAGVRTLPGQFPAFREKFPDKVILSSESAAALSTRGEYQFPVPGVLSAPVRPGSGGDPRTLHVSSYEIFAADFGSSPDRAWAAQDQNPFVAGEFVWSGWDYIGEPWPPYSGARSSYYGIIDLAGFKKDRFYLYQSRWRPDLPMVHILPHWTWPDRVGEVTPVHVFTSGDEAELFINGKSQGRRKKAPFEYRLRWDYVTYEPGEVKAVAYKNGKEWATSSVKTADAPARLEMTPDRASIRADGLDLSFVSLRIADKSGITAPRADNRVRFTVEGPGEIVATDNGDPTSFESFQSPERKAFNGLCLVVVRGISGLPGKITVRAESPSLQTATATLQSR